MSVFKSICFFMALLCIVNTSNAQTYTTILGDSLIGEKGLVSHLMPDSSIWLVGATQQGTIGGGDIVMIRLDALGNPIGNPSYFGTPDLDYPNNMLVQDHQLIIVGEIHRTAGVNGFVLVLDTAGQQLSWSEHGLAGQSEQFFDIKPTRDNGFVVAGFGSLPNVVGNDFLVAKFDSLGANQWLNFYDLGQNDIGVTIVERPTGGYLVAGDQNQRNNNYNVVILSLDSLGNREWDNVIRYPYNGGCKNMQLYQDQIVIVGEMATPTSSAFDWYLIRLDLAGQLQWQGTIPQSDRGDAIFDIAIVHNNKYYLTGYSYNNNTSNTDIQVMAVDSLGQILAQQYYGSNSFDMGYDIQVLPNESFMVTGFGTYNSDNQMVVIRDKFNLISPTNTLVKDTPSLTAYPNPTINGIVQIKGLKEALRYELTIYNSTGIACHTQILPPNHQVNISHLDTGIYWLAIHNPSTGIEALVLHKQ